MIASVLVRFGSVFGLIWFDFLFLSSFPPLFYLVFSPSEGAEKVDGQNMGNAFSVVAQSVGALRVLGWSFDRSVELVEEKAWGYRRLVCRRPPLPWRLGGPLASIRVRGILPTAPTLVLGMTLGVPMKTRFDGVGRLNRILQMLQEPENVTTAGRLKN